MEIQEARETVCRAGLKLVKEGLVARTWGNISCRIDENRFVITPSGRHYDDLTPGDIVEVRIDDLKWSGHVKPSSEKGLHGEVYKLYPAAGAVIHTHQLNASVAASARREIPLMSKEMETVIGPVVPCASYALPGTSKLMKATASALQESGSRASLMANHGAICYGTNMDEAFQVALLLEDVCAAYIQNEYLKRSGEETFDRSRMYETYIRQSRKGRRS